MSYFYLTIEYDEWAVTRFPPCVDGRTPDPLYVRILDYPTIRDVMGYLAGLERFYYGGQTTIDMVYMPFYDGCNRVKVLATDLDNSLKRLSEYSLQEIAKNRLPECKPKPIYRNSRFNSCSFANTYADAYVDVPDLVEITSYGDHFIPTTKWEFKGEEISFHQAEEIWREVHKAQRLWYLGGLPDCYASWDSQEVAARRRSIKNPSWKDGVFIPVNESWR